MPFFYFFISASLAFSNTFTKHTQSLPSHSTDTLADKEGTSQDHDENADDDANGDNDGDTEGDVIQDGDNDGNEDDDDEDNTDDDNDPLAFLRWRRRPAAFIFLDPNYIVKKDGETHIKTDPTYNMEPLKKDSEESATMSMEPVVLTETIIRRPSVAMSDKMSVSSKSAKGGRGMGRTRGRKKYGAL